MNYLENLRILRQAVLDEPDAHFNLSQFEKREPCGTLHCTAGLATTLPHFQALGLKLEPSPYNPSYVSPVIPHLEQDRREALDTALNYLFQPYPNTNMPEGDGAFEYLFDDYGDGRWDRRLLAELLIKNDAEASHKELALARLDKAITLWEAAA